MILKLRILKTFNKVLTNMKLFPKIINSLSSKNYIFVFVIFFLLNNLIVFGSENKLYPIKSKKKIYELEEIYKLKSIPYSEYDKVGNQLKIFFGFYSKKYDINNYPDLSIIDTSDSLRDGYIMKLNDMTIFKTNCKLNIETICKN